MPIFPTHKVKAAERKKRARNALKFARKNKGKK
jgi:hypothetical protein